LAILRRPAAGAALPTAIVDWLAVGIDTVLCLLEESEVRRLGLEGEGEACRQAGLEFMAFPIPDFGVPASVARLAPILREIGSKLRAGASVGVHCYGSVGRSGLVSSCLMVALGYEPIEAFHVVSKARGVPVPETPEQRRWIEASVPALRDLGI
jgi:protein-tyrosine phosphatase